MHTDIISLATSTPPILTSRICSSVNVPIDLAVAQKIVEVGEVANSRGDQVGCVGLEGEPEAACMVNDNTLQTSQGSALSSGEQCTRCAAQQQSKKSAIQSDAAGHGMHTPTSQWLLGGCIGVLHHYSTTRVHACLLVPTCLLAQMLSPGFKQIGRTLYPTTPVVSHVCSSEALAYSGPDPQSDRAIGR